MEINIDKAAILIAEAAVTTVEALGKSFNDERIHQGYSAGYNDSQFSYMATELRQKIEVFKSETEIK